VSQDPTPPRYARPTCAEIDLAALRHNVEAVRTLCPRAAVMGVVKANAYGHGLVPVARELVRCGVEALGVAFVEEGVALRAAGITAPILVLGGLSAQQIVLFIEHDLMMTAASVDKMGQIDAAARRLGRRAQVHLKIDTGMERLGVHHYNAHALFEAALAATHCGLCGVFSHLANSDSFDPSFAREQLRRFECATAWFPNHGLPMPLRHIANSGAILQHAGSSFDMVRPGIMLYGVYPSAQVRRTVKLAPVLSLKTRVVYFKVTAAGAGVGYDQTWTAPRQTRIVTLPVGYGDGYRRNLSNKGQVLLRGHRYPIVGTISMDQMTVNIDWDEAYNGDEVVLIGQQGGEAISIEEVAEWADTIPYELLTALNARVPRRYLAEKVE
jgi:alanine racemase